MAEYVCVDGPLAGQSIGLDEPLGAPSVVIEVVDIDQDSGSIPRYRYVVEAVAAAPEPGTLRFAAATTEHEWWDMSSAGTDVTARSA